MKVSPIIFTALFFLFIVNASAHMYSSDWTSHSRRWIGPSWWANPLQDWSLQSGQATTIAGHNRSLCLTSFTVATATNPTIFETSVTISISGQPAPLVSVGFQIGRRARNSHWMSSLVDADKYIEASLFSTGILKLGRKTVQTPFHISNNKQITLTLKASQITPSSMVRLELVAPYGTLSIHVNKIDILGGLALFTGGPDMKNTRKPASVHFTNFSINGQGVLDVSKSRQLGPILWTQYTLSENVLRLQAQLAPIEQKGKTVTVVLSTYAKETKGNRERKLVKVAEATMHPLARTATFSVRNWNSRRPTRYVVQVSWNGQAYRRWGVVRAEPQRNKLKLAVFSCDHGYLFPHSALVNQVWKQNPDVVLFLGDQIYESYGGFGARTFGSVPDSMLDYLRKFYQFGLSWRNVLRDRPSIIIPDDHDVFQGNLFGHGGRKLPIQIPPSRFIVRKTQKKWNASLSAGSNENISRQNKHGWYRGRPSVPYSYISYGRGGYFMPGAWVSAVEQTQVGHLPAPAKPNMRLPIGIRPYFTRMEYSQVSFAILEDRKFKTGYMSYKDGDKRKSKGKNGSLLGKAQEQFLHEWGENSTGHDMKIAVSQTLFAKATTHSGHRLARSSYIFDSGAWPVDARNRAVHLLSKAGAMTLHGDQHMGAVMELDDGAGHKLKSFMVPGTANGWPRAWWPHGSNGQKLGNFKDDAGHNIRMMALANPDPGSNLLVNLLGNKITPAELAYRKGSGYGIVILNKVEKTAKIELYRIGRNNVELFEGFPQHINVGEQNFQL